MLAKTLQQWWYDQEDYAPFMGRYAVCLTRLTAILYKLWRSEVFSVLLQLSEGQDGCLECYRYTSVGHSATTSDGSGI